MDNDKYQARDLLKEMVQNDLLQSLVPDHPQLFC